MYRKLTIILLLGLLSGCTAKLSYSFADWIVEWAITDYVSPDRAQKKQLRLYIDQRLEWHKKSQLSRYKNWLIEFRERASQGLDRQWLQTWSGRLNIFWQDIALEISPDAIAFLRSLSERQVEEIIASLNKRQREMEEKYLNSDQQKRLEKRQQRTEKSIRRLLGKLNERQKTLIAEWNTSSADSTALWLENRERWAKHFEAALEARHDEHFDEEISRLFVYQEQLWSDAYRQSVKVNLQKGIDLALAIESTVDEKQRKKLNKFLNKWVSALDKLSS